MLVEFTKGKLPWRKMISMDEMGHYKQDCRTIEVKGEGGEKKKKTKQAHHLLGGCPRQYSQIMKTITELKFFDSPKYEAIYKLLRKALQESDCEVCLVS